MIGDLSVSEFGARLASSDPALRESTLVPLGVAERCTELLSLAVRAAELGNRFLISDAAVGAELAAAGRAVATALKDELRGEVATAGGALGSLAIVRGGGDEAAEVYARRLEALCEELGVGVRVVEVGA